MKNLIILILSLFLFTAVHAEVTLYVSVDGDDANGGTGLDQPFATLNRAFDEVKALQEQMDQPEAITIYLRDGLYNRSEPLILSPEHSGTEEAPVTVHNYSDEEPVISGGKVISGWKKGRNGVWTTRLPEVRKGNWEFRQLYVNGELRRRARIPNEGFLRVAGHPDGGPDIHYHTDIQRFRFHEGDIDPDWTNLEDVEVIVYHFWTDSHLPIESIDTDSNIVKFKHKAGKVFTDDFTDDGARYIVENVYEGLDRPGEWYLNEETGVLSYIPKPGEDMRTAEVIAPVIPEFMRFEGLPLEQDYVENIHFRGLSFIYTNWDLPPGNSNDRQGSASVPAAVTMKGTRNCSFSECTVKNIGTYAFELVEGCSDNLFTHNQLSYLAAGGFRVNGGDDDSHPLERTGHNIISDNVLHHFGEVYPSAVGVLLMHTNGNKVSHNHIHHGYYTGISIGWEWGYQRSVATHNTIAYNHIHDIGQGLLSDMGAIYTLGVSPGTVIRNNLIHDVNSHRYGGWGIYNDEGSTHILIENNIVYNTKFSGYNIHYGKELIVRNNIFALARINELSRSRVEPHKSVFFENNIVYWRQGELMSGNWSDREYTFYYHPKNSGGSRNVESTFEMDYNIYYNPDIPEDSIRFDGEILTEWQNRGKDVHSIITDPMFVDPENYDFSLQPGSPAFDLGFKPIDTSSIGPKSH